MKAFFFGAPERQLFGAYHPADEGSARDTAVVLAYPWMAEYNMVHFAFRKLASMLSREGFPTLRFDYFGTGDSMGTPAQARYADWVGDVVMAAKEVLDLSGVSSVSIAGRGLGAALAVEAAAVLPVRDLVLWEPVIRGSDYLKQLEQTDAAERLRRLYPSAPPLEQRTELLGFPMSAAGRAELAAVDILRVKPSVDGRIVVVGAALPAYRALIEGLEAAGHDAQLEIVEDDTKNEALAGGASAMLDSKPLLAVTSVLSRGQPS